MTSRGLQPKLLSFHIVEIEGSLRLFELHAHRGVAGLIVLVEAHVVGGLAVVATQRVVLAIGLHHYLMAAISGEMTFPRHPQRHHRLAPYHETMVRHGEERIVGTGHRTHPRVFHQGQLEHARHHLEAPYAERVGVSETDTEHPVAQ